MAATNEAFRKLDEESQSSMAKITGGMGGLGGCLLYTSIKNIKRKISENGEHKLNSPWNIAADYLVDMSFSALDMDHIRHHTAEIVLDRKSPDGKHLRYIRIGFIFHGDHVFIGVSFVSHGTAVGLDIYDICPRYRQGRGSLAADILPLPTCVFRPLVGGSRGNLRGSIIANRRQCKAAGLVDHYRCV